MLSGHDEACGRIVPGPLPEPTLTAYAQDLRAFLDWCQVYEREPLPVSRGELEMYVRQLESRGYAVATVARRFGTVATLYKPWSACSGCSGFEGRRPARLTSPTCASRPATSC